MKRSLFILRTLLFLIMTSSHLLTVNGQGCANAEDWEEEVPGEPLQMNSGFGGYFAIAGTPQFTNENCTPNGGVGLQIQAGINGPGSGDVVGYTQTFGINPQPTFLSGVTYQVSGLKLLSDATMGSYSDIIMNITLVNAMGAVQVVEKNLMLIQGQCESWDPPATFVAPDDFSLAEISITAVSDDGADDLFIIIDDWCIEEVMDDECFAEFAVEPLDNCGKYQFFPQITAGVFDNWVINGPNGYNFSSSDVELCHVMPSPGIYVVDLIIICGDGMQMSFTQTVVYSNDAPIFEACTDELPIVIEGMSSDVGCVAEYIIPDLLPFDDSGVFTTACFLDATTPVVTGQAVTLSEGPHTLFCIIQDECQQEATCFLEILVSCEGTDPCDYVCCDGDPNWPVEGLTLGTLPSAIQMGYYAESGTPEVVEDGCDGSSQSIEIAGTDAGLPGEIVGITAGGVGGSIDIFEEGKTYCITYCLRTIAGVGVTAAMVDLYAATSPQTIGGCTGSCEAIGSSTVIDAADGWVTQSIIYTPSNTYEHLLFENNNTAPIVGAPKLRIDNVCISENPEPIPCAVSISILEEACGKVIVDTEVCGELEEMTILYDDGFESFEVEDTTACIEYTSAGPWTVTVSYVCAGEMTIRTVTETFTLEGLISEPVITCPADTVIALLPEGDCIAEVFLGSYIVDDPAATVQCYVSGTLVVDPTIPLQLPVGIAQVEYIATNACGADTCGYEIEVTCEPVMDKYDCPIDVLFIMDNSGSIDPSEYADMQASALAEINAISSVYTNSKFGVLHYSGECGETITIEHDFQNASSLTSIVRQYPRIPPFIMDDLNEALGATINALSGAPDPNILSGTLTPDASADLYIVIFTDAQGALSQAAAGGCTNSALRPYTNSNILKSTFGANISVVHFIPGFADDVAAAIASPGGNYTGIVDLNPGDPTNGSLPRQYIAVPFGTPNIDLLDILPPCVPCVDCDDLVLTSTETSADSCCYSIDFNNGYGPDIVKVEAEIITPDWQFNTANTNPGAGFQWYPGTVTTGSKLCLTGNSSSVPAGPNPNMLDYCFSPSVPSPSGPQIVVFNYYTLLGDTLFELQCTDTLTTECTPEIDDPCLAVDDLEVMCQPDNAYEYEVNLMVTNNSGFTASNVTLSGIGLGFQFAQCGSSSGVTSIAIPIPGGLADNSSTSICVKIIAPFPILNPTQLCFDIGINSFTDCCHSPDDVCVTLDPCCDPCAAISTTYSTLSVDDQEQCCYSIDVDYSCDYLYFSKIRFKSLTAGVTFGYHALGNPSFQMCGSSSTDLCIEPIPGLLPSGTYTQALDICFDEITDPAQVPQIVLVEYQAIDPATNLDTTVCSEELVFECLETDNSCLLVEDQDLVCLPDSSKYRYTFTITNTSSLPFQATDVDVFIMSPSDLVFVPGGGTFPLSPSLGSNQSQTISACLESVTATFPSTATDIVMGYRLRYSAGDTCCYESVLDTIAIPPCDEVPTECFTVVDVESKGVVCGQTDCYADPLCQAWIVDKIANSSCFGVATVTVEKAYYNSQPIIIVRETYLDAEIETVYTCDGEVLQSCSTFMALPAMCNPNAGIDLATDLTSLMPVWDCSQPVPTFDPLACIAAAAANVQVDYCVKLMNNSPAGYTADQIALSGILPSGISIHPMIHATTIPAGGMQTVNLTASGTLLPGDTIKIGTTMSGRDTLEVPWECQDTICLVVPPCPEDACCQDETQFLADVAQGFQVTNLGDCVYQVCANQFDTCHWFGNLAPDWGDGGTTLPSALPSNPPNNCWTHQYTSNGTFKISLPVFEGSTVDDACWDGLICATVVADCCTEDPCDQLAVTSASISSTSDSCCTLFTVENSFCDDYFKGLRIEIAAPASISQLSAQPGFVVNQITPQVAEVRPLLGFIGQGLRDVFSLCTTGYVTSPHQVTISWLVPTGDGGCIAECASMHDISCDVDPPVPDKCYEFVEDSIHCETNTYCFKIKNTSSPAFDINSVALYDLSNTLGLLPSGRISIPTLASGMTSDWICVDYFGANPGDNACFKISAHNAPANLPPTKCCTDTIETCFVIPTCPTEQCGVCPSGATAGPNLVVNGDFETGAGYTGWTSAYTLQPTGLMSAGEYSVRNQGTLVNTQWAAVDHTSGMPTGQFLAIDGPSGQVAYKTTVTVTEMTDYVFCMWVDNLVATSTVSNPVIEVSIGGTIVEAGRWLPQSPDGWQLITLTYNSSTNNGPVDIEVRDIAGVNYNDWAIDDVSFRQCETTVIDECCDVDIADILTYYGLNTIVDRDSCEICLTFPIDTCDTFEFRYDDEPFVNLVGSPTICKSYSDPGPHFYSYRITRFDVLGDTCFHDTFNAQFDLLCDTTSVSDPCCDEIDEASLDAYYFNSTSFGHSDCVACVIVDLDSCDVGTVTFSGGTSMPLTDNTQTCMQYSTSGTYSYTIDIVRYDGQGDTCYQYLTTQSFDLVCDDDPPVHPCVEIIADSIDCETNSYCFKIVNKTAPSWTIRSLAFVNESTGHSLNPDPVGIPPLMVGDTSDWICVSYTAAWGDTVCYNLVAHQEDLAAGAEPQFCCTNPEPICFVAPDCQRCLACPNGNPQGPNLIMNSDFEGGYSGFTSDYQLQATGQLSAGQYSIRNSMNLDNTQWTAIDHTTGSPSGNFLVLDGPATPVAYRTMVPMKPNTQYVLCFFATNLVNSDIDSDPTLEVSIGGAVQIPGATIPKQVGQWWLLSVPYFSGSNSGMVSIEIRDIDTDPFNDWGLDDLSFVECVEERVCCEDEGLFEDLLDIGWTVSLGECSVTVSAPQLDSCHWINQAEPDWGDGSVTGQVLTSATGSWTHTYDQAGTYTICATIFEGEDPDTPCFTGEMCIEVDLSECPEVPVPCDVGDLTIYNAVTPDGNGLNDVLSINGGEACRKNIKIFNRWGQMVWSQENYRNDWKGQSFTGEQLPDGTYYLMIELPDISDRDSRMRQTYIELRN